MQLLTNETYLIQNNDLSVNICTIFSFHTVVLEHSCESREMLQVSLFVFKTRDSEFLTIC